MEKKKLVKPIVIATSVAAVVGIGAVSFAAWSGGTTTDTQNGNTGSVDFLSFNETNVATATLTDILPHDQKSATPSTTDKTLGSVAFAQITLPTDIVGNYYITVKAVAGDTDGIAFTNSDKHSDIYVSLTAPSAAITLSEWTKANTENGAKLEIASTEKTPTIYVILDSNDSAQMNKSFKLDFTLSAT